MRRPVCALLTLSLVTMNLVTISLVTISLFSTSIAQTPATSPFVDVPPCHYAAAAIARIATPTVPTTEQKLTSRYRAANALNQVFEGLRCGTPSWSGRFVRGAPASFGTTQATELAGFRLENVRLDLLGARGTIRFDVVTVFNGQTIRRQGQTDLVFVDDDWHVTYAGLAALGLPFFP